MISTRSIFFNLYMFACILFLVIQFLLGTDVIILLLSFFSLLIAVVPFLYFGIFDITSLFVFGLMSKYSVLPLFIKTLMGERVDIGLLCANDTFLVIFIGSVLSVTAWGIARHIPLKKRMMDIQLPPNSLAFLGYIAFAIGFLFAFLHIVFSSVLVARGDMEGFGGFGSFIGLVCFGIICVTVYITRYDSSKNINFSIFLMLFGALFLSFLANKKIYFIITAISYLGTLFVYGRRISIRKFLLFVLFVLFLHFVVVPVVQLLRTEEFKTAGVYQRIDMLSEFIINDIINQYDASSLSSSLFNYDYYPKIHSPIIDRLEMIQDLDLVIEGTNKTNLMGMRPILMGFKHAMPSLIVKDKIPEIDVDFIAYKIGYFPILTSLRHTFGLFGVSYAMVMWPGWVFISFLMIFLFLFFIRIIVADSVFENIFGIYLLANYGIKFSETGVQSLIVVMVRAIPIDVLTILLLIYLTKMITMDKKHPSLSSF